MACWEVLRGVVSGREVAGWLAEVEVVVNPSPGPYCGCPEMQPELISFGGYALPNTADSPYKNAGQEYSENTYKSRGWVSAGPA